MKENTYNDYCINTYTYIQYVDGTVITNNIILLLTGIILSLTVTNINHILNRFHQWISNH